MKTDLKEVFKGSMQNYLVFGVSLVVILGLVFFLILPWITETLNLGSSIAQEKERVASLTQKESILSKTDSKKISNILLNLNSALPNEKEIPSLLTGINRVSNESGLTVKALQINPGQVSSASATPQSIINFQITLEGSYEALVGFLKNMERAKRLFFIEDVSASLVGDNQVLTIVLSISAPYQGFPQAPQDILSPVPQMSSEEEKLLALINKFTDYTIPVLPGATGKENPFR